MGGGWRKISSTEDEIATSRARFNVDDNCIAIVLPVNTCHQLCLNYRMGERSPPHPSLSINLKPSKSKNKSLLGKGAGRRSDLDIR